MTHRKTIVGMLSMAACRTGRICVVAVLMLGGLAGPALAQLSSEDIAALRERGQAEGWTFTVGENEATRRPLHELCGAVEPPDWRLTGRFDPCTPKRDLPVSFDWRDYNACTPIRNQGGCGSCWAFGAMGSVECTILLNEHVSRDLSEQWLVSCTDSGSCGGGWHTEAYEYLRCNGWSDPCGHSGAVLDSDFPYVAWDAPCGCPYEHPYCIDDWAFVGPPWGTASVEQIKQAILDHGPVSTCVYVNDAFQGYGGGVFNACESHWINHVVVLVGWDDNQGTDGVWIVRNSWGPWWGEYGYMRIEYGCSEIGYATAYVDYTVWDCNRNGIPDDQDIAEGTSLDDNGNGVPDECECAAASYAPQAEPATVAKNRYISFVPGNPGQPTALRVRFTDLPEPFTSFEDEIMWVAAPEDISEDSGSSGATPPTFKGAQLTSDPVYRDWSADGLLHVYGGVIVPGATYEIQAIDETCATAGEVNYSIPLTITTSLWGDVVGDCAMTPCSPPDGDCDFDDIAAIVDKFRNLAGALMKARADIVGDSPLGIPDRLANFLDISCIVEAFRGLPYPFAPPSG
ncbi:MAG: C1 family peptidase [Phycisphaerae bacterium]